MSQFLIVISESKAGTTVPNITFVHTDETQQIFCDAVDYYQISPEHAWAVLDKTGDTTDSIFSDAGGDISQGNALSSTELGKLLGELIYSGAKLLAWYACEYDNLVKITNVIELIEILNKELPAGSGEIYVEYR